MFDASSIINLIKRGIVSPLANGETLNLALYESMSAVWKEYRKLKVISRDLAAKYIGAIIKVMNIIPVNSINGSEEEVFDLALKEDLTIYDASYLLVAINRNLILVTDDKVLRDKASRYVIAMSTKELLTRSGFVD
ncbi:DNA-binding protein [Sulfolobus acidocaldarius SUSAZ]|nr:DNA-binding protein [Sulfolobus acidocaldarius SUSAZ]